MSLNQISAQEKEIHIKSLDSLENFFLIEKKIINKINTRENTVNKLDFLTEQLKKEGFFLNRIDSITEQDHKKTVFISLGPKTNFIKLKTQQTKNKTKEKLLKTKEVIAFIDSLTKRNEMKGFLFSEIKLIDISLKKDTLYATLINKQKKRREINSIIIKGYPEFSKKRTSRFLNIKSNTSINNEKIKTISNNTKRINFITEVKPPEVLFKKDSTLLYLYLKKKKNNNFDGILNFASKENKNGILFTGHLKLALNNIFSTGENIDFAWVANGEERQNLNLSTKLPYILNSPINLESTFKLHRQDSSFTSNIFKTNLLYNLNHNLSTGISYTSENSTNTLTNDNNDTISNYKKNFLGINFKYKYKELNINLTPAIGNRVSKNKTQTQYNITSQISYLHQINLKNAIFINNETRALFSKKYLTNELYRIGGANSIRGFNEESIFTSKYSFANIEYRYLTSKKTHLYTITDFGIAEIQNSTEKIYGLGLGYSFKQKNSLINISTVIGKISSQKTELNNSKLILKFTTYF